MHEQSEKQVGKVNILIPKVIREIYPKMNYEDYKLLKTDVIFLSKKAYVCEACFLKITGYCSFSGINTKVVLRALKPEVVRYYTKKNKFDNTKGFETASTFFKTKTLHNEASLQATLLPTIRKESMGMSNKFNREPIMRKNVRIKEEVTDQESV